MRKKGVGFDEYRVVPPPPAQVYSSPMPDLSWTGLPEFADNTVTDYTRPTPSVDVTNDVRSELDGNNLTVCEHGGTSSNAVSNNFGPPIIEDWDSEDESDTESTPIESIRSFSTARTSLNVAQPKMKSFVKSAHSNVKRPFERKAVAKNKIWVPTVRTKNPIVGLKVPTAKPTIAATKGNKGKVVKDLMTTSLKTLGLLGKPLDNIDDKGFWDSGCSRHMTGNISYLSDYEPYDGGYVSFGYGGGKIIGKGTIKTEAARTMLADAKLPVTFWAEAVNTACYVQNRVLVTKPLNKTPYELFNGRAPAIGFLRPFGCHVMILNTLDHLGKFDAKGDEGFFVGYSLNSKAFRVYNKRTKHIEENLHINFLESKVIDKAGGPNWLFDIESLIKSMNYIPVETIVPNVSTHVPTVIKSRGGLRYSQPPSISNVVSSENRVEDFFGDSTHATRLNEVEADLSNMETTIQVSPTPTLRIHKDHPKNQIIGHVDTPVLTRHKSKNVDEQSCLATIHQKSDPDLLLLCLFLAFLSQEEPKKISEPLKDSSWVRPIGTKWDLKNKKDKRGIVIKNKVILVAQGHTQEEGIDYKQVFVPVARIEAISLLVFKILSFHTKSIRWSRLCMDFTKHLEPGMVLCPSICWIMAFKEVSKHSMDRENPWGKGGRNRHQVTPKECHLHAVKRIFRYLKGHPKLGLWYPKESPFDLVAYSDSDYGGASQDRKSTTRGCQFLGRRLISWQCKKQTIMATSTTEAEYVAAASGCGQVLWIQNQLLDYGGGKQEPHNTDFHQIVDFLQASHIRYALTCLSPKSTSFNEFSSNIATALGEGLENQLEPHHTPSTQHVSPPHPTHTSSPHDIQSTPLEAQTTPQASLPHTTLIPSHTPTSRRMTKRVTSLGGDEGSLKQKLKELMEFCTTLQSQQTQMAEKIQSQDLEIKQLKARIQTLEDAQKPREGVQEDAPNREE
ncbi:putative ribonuclease H-like domain-containing protein [Tanacetum coccineum]